MVSTTAWGKDGFPQWKKKSETTGLRRRWELREAMETLAFATRALDVSEQKELWGFNRNFILQVGLLPLESLEP